MKKFLNIIHISLLVFFVGIIRLYQLVVSPWFGMSCRFVPTCSQYTIEAFKKYGILKGFVLAIKRISSCRPGGRSGYDPVPPFLKKHK